MLSWRKGKVVDLPRLFLMSIWPMVLRKWGVGFLALRVKKGFEKESMRRDRVRNSTTLTVGLGWLLETVKRRLEPIEA